MTLRTGLLGAGYDAVLRPVLFSRHGGDPEAIHEELVERLERPDKHYKYNPGDVDERARWDEYMAAYQVALTRCSTVAAPWHVVPADRKWYARYAVQQLLLEKLRQMSPDWPVPDYDIEAEKERLANS